MLLQRETLGEFTIQWKLESLEDEVKVLQAGEEGGVPNLGISFMWPQRSK